MELTQLHQFAGPVGLLQTPADRRSSGTRARSIGRMSGNSVVSIAVALCVAVAVYGRAISSAYGGDALVAIAVDLAWLGLFAAHHQYFIVQQQALHRRWWPSVRANVELGADAGIAVALVAGVLVGWMPLPTEIWSVSEPAGAISLWLGCAAGWGLIAYSTQQLMPARARSVIERAWTDRPIRGYGRSAMVLGGLLVSFATPSMTAGHLLVAVATGLYLAARFAFGKRTFAWVRR